MASSKRDANRLLIVDDDRDIANFLASVATKCGFQVTVLGSVDELERLHVEIDPTVVLLDLQMPGRDGVQALKILGDSGSKSRVILISGVDSRTLRTTTELGEVMGLAMSGPLQKPIPINLLRQSLLGHKVDDQLASKERLREAIDKGRIRPHYQPKAGCSTPGKWQVHEFEALARWHKSDSEILLPNSFLASVEDNDLLPAMTDSMLRQVVFDLRTWREAGICLAASVNISPSLLQDRTLPDRLEALTTEAGVSNCQLTLEITENVILEYTAETIEVLSRLRVKEFGLALDDFGTGYSSLQQLLRMPFNELKIDRSFVRNCQNSEEARTIVETTLILGQKLGLAVCAEGVETSSAFTYLEGIGCDKQQGYYVGRPAPASTVLQVQKHWSKDSVTAQPLICSTGAVQRIGA